MTLFGKTSPRVLNGQRKVVKLVEIETLEEFPIKVWIESEEGRGEEEAWDGIDIVALVDGNKYYLATLSKDGLEVSNLQRQVRADLLEDFPLALDGEGHIKVHLQDEREDC